MLMGATWLLPKHIQGSAKSNSETPRRALAPIMEEHNHRARSNHMVVNRHNAQPVRSERLENWSDLVLKHGNVACDNRSIWSSVKCRPRVESHTRIDRTPHLPHFEVVPSNRVLIHLAVLL